MPTLLANPVECKPRISTEFESIGEILRRLRLTRRTLERRIRPDFEHDLSLQLDRLLMAEELIQDALTTECAV